MEKTKQRLVGVQFVMGDGVCSSVNLTFSVKSEARSLTRSGVSGPGMSE